MSVALEMSLDSLQAGREGIVAPWLRAVAVESESWKKWGSFSLSCLGRRKRTPHATYFTEACA